MLRGSNALIEFRTSLSKVLTFLALCQSKAMQRLLKMFQLFKIHPMIMVLFQFFEVTGVQIQE